MTDATAAANNRRPGSWRQEGRGALALGVERGDAAGLGWQGGPGAGRGRGVENGGRKGAGKLEREERGEEEEWQVGR